MPRLAAIPLLALAVLTACSADGRADLVFLKDGYVLQGRVHRKGISEFDKGSRDFIWIPSGFFYLDDGARHVYFSPHQVALVEKLTNPQDERIIRRDGKSIIVHIMPQISEILNPKPFDTKTWERDFVFRSDKGARVKTVQRISQMNPYFVQADEMTRYKWSCAYLTREFEPEDIRKMLMNLKELQDDYMPPVPKVVRRKLPPPQVAADDDKGVNGDWVMPTSKFVEAPRKPTPAMIVARRLRIADFFAQSGWFDLADEELSRLELDFPEQKKRVADAREVAGKLRARAEWEEIKNWYHAGRSAAVRKRVEEYKNKYADDRTRADMREMTVKIAREETLLKEAKTALEDCSKDAKSAEAKALASVVPLIQKELSARNVARLDAFLGQVREVARQKARGNKPTYTSENLLALAVSGFLLGSPSAEARADHAISLWKTRQMVLSYCREEGAAGRAAFLADYEKEVKPAVDLDEVAQLIDSLPPLDPGEISEKVTEMTAGKGKNAIKYHLKLPPEYTHARQYPVLVVLPDANEEATKALEHWEKAAADHGYILIAPEWQKKMGGAYGFTVAEHDTVTEALKDVARRYQVDADRVFLFGLGEGAQMAFDVGLSHPDLFAGIMPMNVGPKKFSARYWRNAQYLPVYVTNGTRAGDTNDGLKDQFKHWIERGYPALWVEYKGRGVEWLGGEVPNMIDWMRHQKRAFPLRNLGDGSVADLANQFFTMRNEDNRFYWLSTKDIRPAHINTGANWSKLRDPAKMSARIDAENNEIRVAASGLRQISIWLGRNADGRMQIDFDREIQVRMGISVVFKKKVTPSLRVLLKDLAQRGDRKHLFVARIDLTIR